MQIITNGLVRAPVIRQVHGKRKYFSYWQRVYLGTRLPFSIFPGTGIFKAQWGELNRGFLSHGPNFRGIAGRPLPTIRRGRNSVVTTFPVYVRVTTFSVHKEGESRYSHQRPGCDGRFLGWYSAEER